MLVGVRERDLSWRPSVSSCAQPTSRPAPWLPHRGAPGTRHLRGHGRAELSPPSSFPAANRSAFSNSSKTAAILGSTQENRSEGIRDGALFTLATQVYPKSWFKSLRGFRMDSRKHFGRRGCAWGQRDAPIAPGRAALSEPPVTAARVTSVTARRVVPGSALGTRRHGEARGAGAVPNSMALRVDRLKRRPTKNAGMAANLQRARVPLRRWNRASRETVES